MAEHTPHYNFTLPEAGEQFDLDVFNETQDAMDEKLYEKDAEYSAKFSNLNETKIGKSDLVFSLDGQILTITKSY